MTNEEALGLVDECIVRGEITPQAHNFAMWEIVRNALEKQIPKKPVFRYDNPNYSPFDGTSEYINLCICGRRITNKPKFCPKCGQAIDWSGE